MITYKPFIFGVDDDLIAPGVKIVWLDNAWQVQRKAAVVERLENEWCVRVSESGRELIINERRIVAIEEGALGNNRRENFVPEVPAKTDHLPPVVAAAVFTEDEAAIAASAHVLHSCDAEECSVCRGGLAECVICGGAEGSLTTECCGRKLTGEEHDKVYSGALDFINGKWTAHENLAVEEKSMVSPAFFLGTDEKPKPPSVTADQVIAAFVKTRDEIAKLKKEFEEAEAKLKALQERRAQWLLVELDKLGGGEKASIKTAHGTAFVEFKESATVADKEAFFGWVEEDFATRKHFLESRVSKTAVKQRLEDGETPPAGVNWVRIKDVKIRRA